MEGTTILIANSVGPRRASFLSGLIKGFPVEADECSPVAVILAGSWPLRLRSICLAPNPPTCTIDLNDQQSRLSQDPMDLLAKFLTEVAKPEAGIKVLVIDSIEGLMDKFDRWSPIEILRGFLDDLVVRGISVVALSYASPPPNLILGLFANVGSMKDINPERVTWDTNSPWIRWEDQADGPVNEDVKSLAEVISRIFDRAHPKPNAQPQAEAKAAADGVVPEGYRLRAEDIGVQAKDVGKDPRYEGVWQNRAIAKARRLDENGTPVTDTFQRALLKMAYLMARARKIGRIREATESCLDILAMAMIAIGKGAADPIGKLTPWELSDLERTIKRIMRGPVKSKRTGPLRKPTPKPEGAAELNFELEASIKDALQGPQAGRRMKIIATMAGEDLGEMSRIANASPLSITPERAARLHRAIDLARQDRENSGPDGQAIRTILEILADIEPSCRATTLGSFLESCGLRRPVSRDDHTIITDPSSAVRAMSPEPLIKLAKYMKEKLV